jgi:hypothetical protein
LIAGDVLQLVLGSGRQNLLAPGPLGPQPAQSFPGVLAGEAQNGSQSGDGADDRDRRRWPQKEAYGRDRQQGGLGTPNDDLGMIFGPPHDVASLRPDG